MNEEGKSTVRFYILASFFMFFACFVYRYFEMTGIDYPTNAEFQAFMLSAEFSEYIFMFVLCSWFLCVVYGLIYLVVHIFIYSVYFVQRAWYIHKLRKPERVYTGDPL